MLGPYARLLEHCEPFLIAREDIRADLNADPLGISIEPDHIIDPQQQRFGTLVRMLRLLDQLTFGPFGMEMPPWVFYDCAVMPGAIFGLALPAAELEPWARGAMQVPDGYNGMVPISQFIAIPMLEGWRAGPDRPPTSWNVYTLESINQVSPGFAPAGVLRLTLALGLSVFPIEKLYATVQWRSPKLSSYADLGPLEILTAYTPAHSLPRTTSLRAHIGPRTVEHLLTAPRFHPTAPAANALLDIDDVAALRLLQRDLERGARAWLVGRPSHTGPRVHVPIHRVAPGGDTAPQAEVRTGAGYATSAHDAGANT